MRILVGALTIEAAGPVYPDAVIVAEMDDLAGCGLGSRCIRQAVDHGYDPAVIFHAPQA